MFVGHYSASFAIKAIKPQVPLWVLFVAAQAVDLGWGSLMLLGVEKARYVAGFTKAFPLDLYYMPYTHSLLAAGIWALAAAALYFLWRRRDGAVAAALVGVTVLSHWFLDLVVHAPDLPLYGDVHKLGFGLWNHPLWSVALELLLLAAAIGAYGRACPRFAARAWKFGGVLALIQIANTWGPVPPSATAIAVAALLSYVLLAFVAWRIEQRQPVSL